MARTLTGTRPRGGGGHLSRVERETLRLWLAEGCSVTEVWMRCRDAGIAPPQESVLYRLRNEPETRELLTTREAVDRQHRIGRLSGRVAERQRRHDLLEQVRLERAALYGGKVAGGSTGLVVEASASGDGAACYKLDMGLLEALLDLERAQASEEDQVRRHLLAEAKAIREMEMHGFMLEYRRFDLEMAKEVLRLEESALSGEAENHGVPTIEILDLPDNGRTRL